MKTLIIIILLLLTNSVTFSNNDNIKNQKKIIYDFFYLMKKNEDSLSIKQYHKFFGNVLEYEQFHLDKHCYINNIDKDSCLLLQKEYCMNPNNQSFTLKYLKNNFFNNLIIQNIEVFINNKNCIIYKVSSISKTGKNVYYYFKFAKLRKKANKILIIYNECFNSILIG